MMISHRVENGGLTLCCDLIHPLQELEALKTELEDSLDTTATVQDLRNKREMELRDLKQKLELSQQQHEAQIQDMRARTNQQIESVNEEVDNMRKVPLLFLCTHTHSDM